MKTILVLVILLIVVFGSSLVLAQETVSCSSANATVQLPEEVEPIPLLSGADQNSVPVETDVLVSNGSRWTILAEEGDMVQLCSPDSPETVGWTASEILVRDTMIEAEESVRDQIVWSALTLPTNPQELPSSHPGASYEDPDQENDGSACYDRSDMEESCSTREGQAVEGTFVLGETERPELRLINGDVILLTDANGNPLIPRIPTDTSGTNHDMFLLFSTGGEVQVQMDAEFGSNRGDFHLTFPRQDWGVLEVYDILGNQLRLAMVNSQPALRAWLDVEPGDPDGPHPVINQANCAVVEDVNEPNDVTYCDALNIYVLEWTGEQWVTHMYGVYGLLRDANEVAVEAAYMDLTSRIAEFADASQ